MKKYKNILRTFFTMVFLVTFKYVNAEEITFSALLDGLQLSPRATVESGIIECNEGHNSIVVTLDPETKMPIEKETIASNLKRTTTFSGTKWESESWYFNVLKEPTGRHHITIFDESKTIEYEEDQNNPLRKVGEIYPKEIRIVQRQYFGFRQKKS